MTIRGFDVLLRKRAPRTWETEALGLPGAKVVNVRDGDGSELSFQLRDDTIVLSSQNGVTPIAHIELPEDLVTASKIEETKIELDRQRLASDERAGRRTIVVSLATAIVSAAATIAVAEIAQHKDSAAKPVPPTFRELHECRESLHDLVTLAEVDVQTLPNLKEAIRKHAQACDDRLKAAEDSSQ